MGIGMKCGWKTAASLVSVPGWRCATVSSTTGRVYIDVEHSMQQRVESNELVRSHVRQQCDHTRCGTIEGEVAALGQSRKRLQGDR